MCMISRVLNQCARYTRCAPKQHDVRQVFCSVPQAIEAILQLERICDFSLAGMFQPSAQPGLVSAKVVLNCVCPSACAGLA